MRFSRLLKALFYSVLLLLAAQSNVFPQCEGVYFKTAKPLFFTQRLIFDFSNPPKDLTGDGKADLLGYRFADTSSAVVGIYILANDGQGGFNTALQELPLSQTVSYGAVRIVDFNSDGKNDLIVNQESSRSVFIYRNNGGGSFTALAPTALDFDSVINYVDINNDNLVDLLTVAQFGQGLINYYRLGNANGTFGNQMQIPFADYGIAADFNNDGKVDFPVVNGSSPNYQMKIYYNQGNAVFSLGGNFTNLGTTGIRAARDFNNDGKVDLLGFSYSSNTVSIIKNLGNDSFSKTDYPLPPPIVTDAVNIPPPQLSDFNGDGFLDFFVLWGAAPFYSIYTNNGAGVFTRRDYNRKWRGAPFGDLDGDNKTDLINTNGFNFFNQNYGVRLFNETRLTVEKNVCQNTGQTRLVDFDGDGITDRAFWRATDGRWLYNRSSAASTFNTFFWGASGDIPVPGDYDGDGASDFAVFRPSDGYWYIRKSSDGAYLFVKFGIGEDKPAPSDYDGDGKTDVAVFRPSEGNWYILYSSTQQFVGAHFGVAEDKPVPADFDGDGKSDLAVYRPSGGVWYILKSSDGSFAAVQWGVNTDKPVPADYDGDLKADLAVFRASEGNWYILRSYNSQFAAFHFGTSGDIPQPGDWDGNGIADLGVYRPNAGNWYSSDTINQFTFGSTGETPVSFILKAE
jgi:hypothetical protein